MNKPIDISTVVLHTPRLTLRPWRGTDLHDLYEYARVDGVGQRAGWLPHKSIAESQKILEHFIVGKKTFAIEHEGKVIGSLGIEHYNEEHYPELAQLQGRELGYVLSKDYWGRGIMPEAVKAVIEYLFTHEKLDFIIAGHFDWNHRSARVIEKCGFTYIKTVPYETRFETKEISREYILYNPDTYHKGTQTIETPRLVLRRCKESDAEPMYRNWASDREVTKYLSWPTHSSAEVSKAVLADWIQNYDRPDYYQWMIELRELSEPIGSVSVVRRKDSEKTVEIGYCIGKKWWHQAVMTEAVQAVIKYLFEVVGVQRIEACHDPRNPHSGGVMRKCGMHLEEIVPQGGRNNQGVCDLCRYVIYSDK